MFTTVYSSKFQNHKRVTVHRNVYRILAVYKALFCLSCYHHKVPGTITVGVGAKSHCHKYSDKIYEHDHDYRNNLDKRQHINKLEAQGLHQKRDSISKLCKTKKHK